MDHRQDLPQPTTLQTAKETKRSWKAAVGKVFSSVKTHTGVGIVCAVAYIDPGNWGVDLQAGSEYGYRLLFVVLLAGLFAVFLQVLASRLGCVTGRDLASHCRLHLYNRPRHTLLYRWGLLYPLYILAEVCIIATDLAELLGSAIALTLLFPSLELWHGVIITACDVVVLLAFRDPLRGRPVRAFEVGIALLVLTVMICMCIVVARTDVQWGKVFEGYLPSKYVIDGGAMYVSVGIIGATVMPHSLFIGSALATQNRLPRTEKSVDDDNSSTSSLPSPSTANVATSPGRYSFAAFKNHMKECVLASFRRPPKIEVDDGPRSFKFVRAHLFYGVMDVVVSLMGFAVVTNSLILILSATVFFYSSSSNASPMDTASLFDAHALLSSNLGSSAGTLFALALLASGQSSSLIATLSAQVVTSGFLDLRLSPVMRRLVTRSIAIIPSVIVAAVSGKQGVDRLLVASQVVLSVVLPFICAPLLVLTSMGSVMRVDGDEDSISSSSTLSASLGEPGTNNLEKGQAEERSDSGSRRWTGWWSSISAWRNRTGTQNKNQFENGWIVKALGAMIWTVIVIANVYVLVRLGMGDT